jgi:GH43 family beta-xylosidase
MILRYQNPVWDGYLADPFVLQHEGVYYAYGTGSSVGDEMGDSRQFPVVRSTDLAHWEACGGALEPLAAHPGAAYWAPEVAFHNGTFYMYYSAEGSGIDTHRLRVATADSPLGPFRDTGKILFPDEGFTIDAHPFRDPKDGQWYLYFAKDWLEVPVGTGTAVVPLADDMMTPLEKPRTVLRASADWHVFARNRELYDQVFEAWHTVEGPFVVERGGKYFCFYAGGAWTTADYGVGYGVADHPLGPFRDDWNAHGPAVLRGVPGKVLGPGHNSVVRGPDGVTDFIVYHAWDTAQTARRMCIDPIEWTADGPRALGPTWEPQQLELP